MNFQPSCINFSVLITPPQKDPEKQQQQQKTFNKISKLYSTLCSTSFLLYSYRSWSIFFHFCYSSLFVVSCKKMIIFIYVECFVYFNSLCQKKLSVVTVFLSHSLLFLHHLHINDALFTKNTKMKINVHKFIFLSLDLLLPNSLQFFLLFGLRCSHLFVTFLHLFGDLDVVIFAISVIFGSVDPIGIR